MIMAFIAIFAVAVLVLTVADWILELAFSWRKISRRKRP
jgi:hypothetical protein